MKLQIKIGNELHKVVYIEYVDGMPEEVITTYFISTADKPYWRQYRWFFFPNNGDKKDIRAYNCGSGGTPKEIQAPHYVDGYIGKYWMANDAKFKGIPKNAKRIKNPRLIADYSGKKSINPFKVAEITNSMEYCEECECFSTEFCDKHKYWDEKTGTEKYINK